MEIRYFQHVLHDLRNSLDHLLTLAIESRLRTLRNLDMVGLAMLSVSYNPAHSLHYMAQKWLAGYTWLVEVEEELGSRRSGMLDLQRNYRKQVAERPEYGQLEHTVAEGSTLVIAEPVALSLYYIEYYIHCSQKLSPDVSDRPAGLDTLRDCMADVQHWDYRRAE